MWVCAFPVQLNSDEKGTLEMLANPYQEKVRSCRSELCAQVYVSWNGSYFHSVGRVYVDID